MQKSITAVAGLGLLLTSCVQSNTMRVSQNEAIIQTSAAPICGGIGAARAAQKMAAVETIKAGYDRYIIVSAAAANNVHATQLPGSYQTYGTINSYSPGYGTVNATTTYTPGATIYSGTHDQSIGVHMFKEGEPGSQQALSARETLGPKWEVIVKDGVQVCNS
jgi:hypothetical protein